MPETKMMLDPGSIRARLNRRSYWACLMSDGTVISEWQRDWTELPAKGRRAIRLYCPNSQIATLDDGRDATGRLVQLKVAVAKAGVGSTTLAHMIGLMYGTGGEMSCAAWNYQTRTLERFMDNAYNCQWHNLGALSVDHLALSPA